MKQHDATHLSVTIRNEGSVVILDMHGRWMREITDINRNVLLEVVADLLEKGARSFVLNLSQLSYVESIGLGFLTTTDKKIKELGGKLLLCLPQPRVLELFQLTHLDFAYTIYNDETAAIRAATSNSAKP
jgi:anti-anti-sigma factor